MSINLKLDDTLENNKQKLLKMEKKVRQNELKLYPYENWIDNKYVNLNEKEMILESIINNIKEWRTGLFELERHNKILGSFCIINCSSCKKWFDEECMNNIREGCHEPISFNIFMKKYEKLNYTCGPKCKFISKNLDNNIKEDYLKKIKARREKVEDVEKLRIGYRVAL